MSLKRPLVLCLLLCAAAVFGEEYPEIQSARSGEITSVSFTGLKRTRSHVAEEPLRKFIGTDAADIDQAEVFAAVMDTGILEPKAMSIEDGPEGKVLSITVKEKWAIIPMPIFFMNSAGFSAGAAVMDTNAFGLRDQMALAGMYRTGGWMAMAMYSATPDRENVPGWNIRGFYSRDERKDTDQKNNAYRLFKLDSITAGGGLNYRVTDFFQIGLDVSFHDRILRETAAPLDAPEEGAMAIGISPGLSIRVSSWDGYFLSRKTVAFGYTYIVGIKSESFPALSASVGIEHSLIPGFRLVVQSGAAYAPDATVFFEDSPSSARVNILPGSFSARNYAGLSASLEKYIFKVSLGTLSVRLGYQGVWSEGPVLGHQFDHGPAGSVQFYLSSLAIPAVGAGLAYNVGAGKLLFSLNMGMSM